MYILRWLEGESLEGQNWLLLWVNKYGDFGVGHLKS